MEATSHARHMRIPPDWGHWIDDSLRADARAIDVLQTLIDNGFDERTSWTAVNEARQRIEGQAVSAAQPASRPWRGRLDEGHVIDAGDRDVRVLVRLAQPVVAVLDGVLSIEECDAFRDMAAARLKRSMVVGGQQGGTVVMDIRTSDGAYFQRGENELVARLDARISRIMRWPEERGEGLQVMRYGVGGEYQPHFDYFDPNEAGGIACMREGGQRVATLIMYLNDVEGGGETIFPRVDFSYVPRKGQGLYFEYASADGRLDPMTLHGGAPVTCGEKWIVTKWMRERTFP
ncbi:MAG: hypothetical protein GAK28_00015 [Luteibacter sp.]|uniref:2OG-Fe(II) oxygenase n=1 Tax=Luteibacter sp. TaxID=1886636 RepID=UPI00138484B4|nr:2OG-Fe(II) oxygenase [Luteibacter sp.]KAF1009378.1 MAG: hypothetical protein GAK28_00015 [Luteibacter sp.]